MSIMSCKDDIGCLRSLGTVLCRTSPPGSPKSKANWKKEKVVSLTGKFLQCLKEEFDWQQCESALDPTMQSSPEVKRPKNMFGKKKQELPALSSSLDSNPFDVKKDAIGTLYGAQPLPATYLPFLPTYEFVATQLSREYAGTMFGQLVWSELAQFFGVKPALESREEHGKKREWTVTLKIPIRR